MVFVTLGTQDKEFKRLLETVDSLIDKGIIKDEVIAQIGCTKYKSKNMKTYKYMSSKRVLKLISESKYVIAHGGVGTIIDSLNLNKKVIAVARLKKYKEHVNDHQLQIVSEFTNLNYILDGTYDLEGAILKLREFKPSKYKSNNENFIKLIENYIDNN